MKLKIMLFIAMLFSVLVFTGCGTNSGDGSITGFLFDKQQTQIGTEEGLGIKVADLPDQFKQEALNQGLTEEWVFFLNEMNGEQRAYLEENFSNLIATYERPVYQTEYKTSQSTDTGMSVLRSVSSAVPFGGMAVELLAVALTGATGFLTWQNQKNKTAKQKVELALNVLAELEDSVENVADTFPKEYADKFYDFLDTYKRTKMTVTDYGQIALDALNRKSTPTIPR